MGMDWTAETGRDSRTAETGMDWTAKMGRDSWTAKTGMDWTVRAFPLSVRAFSHSVCTLAVRFLRLPMLTKQCQLLAHISSNDNAPPLRPVPLLDRPVLLLGQAFGHAYSMGRSHAHSPYLQHRPKLVGGVAPKPPFHLTITSFQILNYAS
jgi:hypothetical protein